MLGIVYVPAKNIIYYTMTGKDAFRIEADGKPEIIEAHPTREQELPVHTEGLSESYEGKPEYNQQPASRALSMCLIAEGKLMRAFHSPTLWNGRLPGLMQSLRPQVRQ